MLKEIRIKYDKFHDAIVNEICYKCSQENYTADRNLFITINCYNIQDNNNFEKIRLYFYDIIYFKFKEIDQSSFVINAALLEEKDGIVIFDFFAEFNEDWTLKENLDSDFIIKCRKIKYEIL